MNQLYEMRALKKYDVIVGGAPHGSGNIGDEAITNAAVRAVKEVVDPARVSVMSMDWPRANALWGIASNAFIQRSYLKYFLSTRLFLYAGATMLSDGMDYTAKLLSSLVTTRTPYILYGVGMNPVAPGPLLSQLVDLCNRAEIITVRDRPSGERLRSLGVIRPRLIVTSDLAVWTASAADERVDEIAARYALDFSKPVVAVGLCTEPTMQSHLPDVDIVARALDHIVELGFNIMFAPIQTQPNCDTSAHARIMHRMRNREACFLVHDQFTPEEMVGLMRRCAAAVSSRLHLLLLAAVAGTPVLGIVRNEKIENVLSRLERPAVSTSEGLAPGDLESAFDRLAANLDSEKARQNTLLEQMIRADEMNREILGLFIARKLGRIPPDHWGDALIPKVTRITKCG